MQWYEILCLCGVPTLGALVVTWIFNSVLNGGKKRREAKREQDKKIIELIETIAKMNGSIDILLTDVKELSQKSNKQEEKTTILSLGLQALLRDRLLELYYECANIGYAKITVRDSFENIYHQYHQLGANGVVDSIRVKFLNLPIRETRENESK